MKKYLVLSAIFLSSLHYASADVIILSDVMSKEDQKRTGVYNLNAAQKKALQEWINAKFVLKSNAASSDHNPQPGKALYLSQNLDNGKILRLSDDSEYLIAPEDTSYSAFWIIPFPVRIEPTDNPEYPVKLVNANNGQWVKARQIKPPRGPSQP